MTDATPELVAHGPAVWCADQHVERVTCFDAFPWYFAVPIRLDRDLFDYANAVLSTHRIAWPADWHAYHAALPADGTTEQP